MSPGHRLSINTKMKDGISVREPNIVVVHGAGAGKSIHDNTVKKPLD